MNAKRKRWLARRRRAADRGDAEAAVDVVEALLELPERRTHLGEARHYATLAIEHGDSSAADSVAIAFLYADGCGGWLEPNASGADPRYGIRLLRKLAKRGNVESMHSLYLAYLRGTGVRKNALLAEHWARRALELGDSEPMNNLGVAFFYRDGVSRDVTRAVRCYRAAAAMREPKAIANLALCYRWGDGVPKDLGRYVRGLRRAAVLGNANACVNLASAYFEGVGVRRNSRRAKQCLRAAGTRTAMVQLSDRLLRGAGMRKDIERGLQLARRLVRLGDMRGAEIIGDHFHRLGAIEPHRYRTAMKWYRRAIDTDQAGATYTAAMCYLEGHGAFVRKNTRRGVALLCRAVELEDANAMCELGERFLDGRGVRRHRHNGLNLIDLAAVHGDRDAPRVLGERYAEGRGLPRNRTKARRWFLEAQRYEVDVRKQLASLSSAAR